MKHLISIHDMSREEVDEVLTLAKDLKARQRRGEAHRLLEGKTLAMIFEKPSTRTRVSFETGIFQLGGHPLVLLAGDTQLGRGETIGDTALVLSRYVDGIMARTFAHQTVLDLAAYGTIPVINGLTDLLHPCQILADLFTVSENFDDLSQVVLTYVGDGNNVANSLMYGCAKVGAEVRIATPKGYEANADVAKEAAADAEKTGGKVVQLEDPVEAVTGAHVIYTDTWTSMGQDDEAQARRKIFQPYQVNQDLLSKADPNAIVLHCLPAHRGDELTDEVMDGPQSRVFDEAENRLHVQKAIMALLMQR